MEGGHPGPTKAHTTSSSPSRSPASATRGDFPPKLKYPIECVFSCSYRRDETEKKNNRKEGRGKKGVRHWSSGVKEEKQERVPEEPSLGFYFSRAHFPPPTSFRGHIAPDDDGDGTNCAPGGDIKEELHPRITSPLRRGNAGERERDWGGRGVMIGTSGRSSVWNCNGGTRAMGGTQNKQAKKERVAECVISVRDWLHGHAIRFPFTHLYFHLVHFSTFISFLPFLVCLHPIC